MSLIDELKQKISNFSDQHQSLNPADIDDAVAQLTTWNPMPDFAGRQQGLRRLVQSDSNNITIKATPKAFIFPIFSMFLSLILVLIALGALSTQVWGLFFVALILGCAFGLTGFFTVRNLRTPRTFDLDKGMFYWGKSISAAESANHPQCPISEIYALQLLRSGCGIATSDGYQESNSSYRRAKQSNSSQPTYQLNLVCNDGSRLNVVEHHDLSLLKSDGAELAQQLNRPVWDVT